jgi:hypothetical protein
MMQIRGIVKAAQTAQDNLKTGIPLQKVASFKAFIQSSIETIERLCTQAQMTPEQLPKRSREAYYFLKRIDLNNLPTISHHITQATAETIRIKNIKTQQKSILQNIFNLSLTPIPSSTQIQQLIHTLATTVKTIEQICSQGQATPANLTKSSRQIYSWMKFLTNEQNLQIHLAITYRMREIAQQILKKHDQELVNVMIELTNFSGLYKSQRVGNTANLVISEGFINAPDEVLQALLKIALFGKSQESIQLIRTFASSEEYSTVLLELDLIAEVIAENPKGRFYNLDELFYKLNHQYFTATLSKPRLVWSKINTYRKFGHYEPARDRVVMNSALDDTNVPEFVVEFVLYHELLHKYHGTKWVNGRGMVHTSEFRRDEKKFLFYQEAEKWLTTLISLT